MKKTIATLLVSTIAATTLMSSAGAVENAEIPEHMNANAVIEYDEYGEMHILNAGTPVATYDALPAAPQQLSVEEQQARAAEDAIVAQIHKDAEGLPVVHLSLPSPQNGMRVSYDGRGNVAEITMKQSDGTYKEVTDSVPLGTRANPAVHTYGTVEPNNVGYTTNKITITTKSGGHGQVLGEGDFTVDDSYYGDTGNYIMKKGDVATKGAIDNPASGTVLETRDMVNNVAHNMVKRDNGGLPNAVLDIWTTGIEYYGRTYTSSALNNCKFAGRYFYTY